MEEETFIDLLFKQHQQKVYLPTQKWVEPYIDELLALLFPAFSSKKINSVELIKEKMKQNQGKLLDLLAQGNFFDETERQTKVNAFYTLLPKVYTCLLKDAEAIENGDPAAKSMEEVMCAYPGFYAICIYRLAHALFQLNIPFIPRMLTEIAHSKTGIDIHPAAQIGSHFFIDHGTGIVIGETSEIGNHVKIYQGVTLGALSVDKDMAETKRHPSIEDGVIIYAGATILGGKTIIGENAIIGGNVWITSSIPAGASVYHQAQITIKESKK